ncbi:MAG TPA: PHP domain-containing protein [Bdellovibrionales bacterium]|nr:PHP domain-containing protein [Bdellovibrionales bacterium]
MKYAELKCKTNYSFLRGGSHPEELITRAIDVGLHALALNDNDGVYGLPKAHGKALELQEKAGKTVKLLIGAELTLGSHAPLTLLCRDKQAYALLCRMITKGHADQPKGHARLEWEHFMQMMSEPGHQGLVALVDPNWAPTWEINILYDEKRNIISQPRTFRFDELKQMFGDRLSLTLSRFLDGHDKKRTENALEASRRFDIPLVATNDVHFHHPNRRVLQDVLTANRHLVSLEEAGRKLFSNAERYLKAPSQMAKLFDDLPEALGRTVEIADSCTFSLSELKYYYPTEWIPKGETAQQYLERLTWEGARGRYPEGIPADVEKQVRSELKLIEELRFADYFLTVWYIVDYARSKKILCQGRGSAANSAVCYCLGITAVDPVRMNLLFERFISAERGEPPDIDVDFEHERREEVIQHIYEKYGRDRAAMVSAVITYKSKAAMRDIKRAFGLDLERDPPENLRLGFERLSKQLRGFPRHLSIHSGGFILSHEPLTNIVPVEPARMENRTIIQWDKYDLDILGLLKVDVLSLGMLSAIKKSLSLIGKELHEIPAEDPATYEMIQKGDTVGTFQIESRAQMNMLGRLKPRTFYDLVVEVAIVRPGPIVGKMVHPYLKRRNGLEPIDYPHPDLVPILGKTLGVPLFQEQVMKIAIVLAGFTPGEADRLRRAIGAWRSNGTIEEMGRKLMKGLLARGLPMEWVQRVFDQIKGFAEYGFPESHAASFALLAYASAWLKRHHQAEFTCSLINSQPMGFYSVHSLVEDAKRSGALVLPIDPNISEWDCTMEELPVTYLRAPKPGGPRVRALRLGFRIVKGIREDEVQELLYERRRRPFTGLSDFLARVTIRRDVLFRLAMGDVFRPFGLDQRQALWQLLAQQVLLYDKNREQLNLFAHAQSGVGAAGLAAGTLRDGPRTVHGEPCASDREPCTRDREPCTQDREPCTRDREGRTVHAEPNTAQSSSSAAQGEPGTLSRSEPFTCPGTGKLAREPTPHFAPPPTENLPQFAKLDDYATIVADYESHGLSLRGHPMQALRKKLRNISQLTAKKLRNLEHGQTAEITGLVIVRQRPPTANGTVFATLEDETGLMDLILHARTFERYGDLLMSSAFLTARGIVQREGWSVSVLVKRLSSPLPPDDNLRKKARAYGSHLG